jgi:hypothetical protein
MLYLLSLLACSSPPSDCPECPDCADATLNGAHPLSQGVTTMEAWEAELLAPSIAALRKGIQLVPEKGFGICSGIQRCETFLSADPGVLPEGEYLVYAELNVPILGEDWAAHFRLHCETTRPDGTTTPSDYDRRYTVRNSGPNRGFRLSPMMRIKSPNTAGPKTCTYTLTPIQPNGVEEAAWSGSYSTL